MENGHKTEPKSISLGYFFATFSERRFLDAIGSPLGSLLAPFRLHLAPFWPLWAPFWSPVAPFGLILVPVGTFGLHFGPFWHQFWSKNVFFGTRSRKSPADCRLHLRRRQIFACTLTFLGPERVYCRRQLRSAPGRGRPRRVGMRPGLRSIILHFF